MSTTSTAPAPGEFTHRQIMTILSGLMIGMFLAALDQTVVSNSFDAHRLLQYAKTQGKGDAMKERLFKAYFTEGKHIADRATLLALANEVGLVRTEVETALSGTAYTDRVRADEEEARQLRITGVPFFVLDRRLGVSGAQSSEHFLRALEQAWEGRSTSR